MEKIKAFFKKIPWYGYVFGIGFLALEGFFYWMGHAVSVWTGTISYAICPKISVIDDAIPYFNPMIIFYVLSYPFWIIGTIAVSLTSKKNYINYLIGLTFAYFIGFLFYVFMPTYMDRASEGILEAASGKGFFNWLTTLIYKSDGTDIAYNLFPSFHCLVSLYCYLGVRRQKEISLWYKIFALVMTLLICASTLMIKQHYFMDSVSGISIAIIVYTITYFVNPSKWIIKEK